MNMSFLCAQEFQEEVALIKDDVTHMNQLASAFDPINIQLSPSNLERVEDLNTRWRLLQVQTLQQPPEPLCLHRTGSVEHCLVSWKWLHS